MDPATRRRHLLRLGLSVVMLTLAVTVYLTTSARSASRRVARAWYYDLETARLFPGPVDQHPPIDAPSGPDRGVYAYVYSCSSCDEANRIVAYLLRYSEEARRRLAEASDPADPGNAAAMIAMANGQLVAAPPAQPGDDPQWMPATPQGDSLRSAWRSACPASARTCYPGLD